VKKQANKGCNLVQQHRVLLKISELKWSFAHIQWAKM
jgi:hypothetical protein